MFQPTTYIHTALCRLAEEDLDFHAGRFESAARLKKLAHQAATGAEIDRKEIDQIAEACRGDGALWGNIPCLGGRAKQLWEAILMTDVSGDVEFLEDVGITFTGIQ